MIREVCVGDERDHALRRIADVGIETVADLEIPERIRIWDLGAGESQVLARGLVETRSEVVLDDLAARRCAHGLGLLMVGTLGVILLSRQRGMIDAARPLLEELRGLGFRLSSSLMNEALSKVGE